MSKLFTSGLKHLGQASVRRCSTESGGAPKKSWIGNLGESIRCSKQNLGESFRRSTADMNEFFESDDAFYGVANAMLGGVIVTAFVRVYKNNM